MLSKKILLENIRKKAPYGLPKQLGEVSNCRKVCSVFCLNNKLREILTQYLIWHNENIFKFDLAEENVFYQLNQIFSMKKSLIKLPLTF